MAELNLSQGGNIQHWPSAIAAGLAGVVIWSNKSLSSWMHGGLSTTASTGEAVSPHRSMVPPPVIKMTGVLGDSALIIRATHWPSISGMPKSVMTTS